jgi:hypothetical protein
MSSHQRLGNARLLYIEAFGAGPDEFAAAEYLAHAPTPAPLLFEQAYDGDREDDATWRFIHELRLRATAEVFNMAVGYCDSRDPRWREIGLDVLAQLGSGRPVDKRPYLPLCRDLALRGLEDPNTHVVRSAAMALAHLNADCPCPEALLALAMHADPEVRLASALGLVYTNSEPAQQALLRLMEDEDQDVRDWATMAIGQGAESSPEVIEALRKRWREETFEDARDEAIWGLVRLHDREAIEELLERFQRDAWVRGDMMAIRDLHGYQGEDPPDEEIIEATRYYLHTHP